MNKTEAKRWLYRYFGETLGGHPTNDPDDLFPVVDVVYGCLDDLPERLREEYPRAHTYHDLWFETWTDRIIEGRDEPEEWMPELYHIYVKDQAIRGTEPPSKAGFRSWLYDMIGDDEVCDQVANLRGTCE